MWHDSRNLQVSTQQQWTNKCSSARGYWCGLPLCFGLIGFLLLLNTFSVYSEDPPPQQQQLVLDNDSSQYPDVQISLSLLGVEPTFMLQASNYSITGTGITSESPLGEVRSIQGNHPLNLVMVLDCSVVDENDWVAVRQTALAVLERLTPQDQVTILAYGTQVTPIHDWVAGANQAAARSVLNLVPQPTRSAFNAALRRASEIAEKMGGRSAILMIVDRADTIENPGFVNLDLLDRLHKKRPPLYIYGYGGVAQADRTILKAYSDASGGVTKVVGQANQLVDEVAPLFTLLRRQFVLTQRFASPANNKLYTYTVAIKHGDDVVITSTDSYQARPRALQITLHGLDIDQPRFGLLEISTTVTAPLADVNSLTYELDGERLFGPVAYREHKFIWNLDQDLGVKKNLPGQHTLVVRVQDTLGNVGSDDSTFWIAQPLTATVAFTQNNPVKLGDPIRLPIRATSEFTLQQIILSVGSQLTKVVDLSAPTRGISRSELLTLTGLAVGNNYPITMTVEDVAGRSISVASPIFLTIRPFSYWERIVIALRNLPPNTRWLIAITALGSLLGLLFTWVMLALLVRRYRAARTATYWIQLVNLGNVPSRYQFRAREINNNLLDFVFTWAGLPPVEPAPVSPDATISATNGVAAPQSSINNGATHTATGLVVNDMPSGSASNQNESIAKTTVSSFAHTRRQATKWLGLTKGAASFLSLIGTLPGPLGEPARRLAIRLRSSVNAIEQAGRSVERVSDTVRKVGETATTFTSRTSQTLPPSRSTVVEAQSIRKEFVEQKAPASQVSRDWDPHQNRVSHGTTQLNLAASQDGWSRPLLLQPGEVETVTVQIYLRHTSWRSRHYQVEIHALNVADKDTAPPLIETVRLGGFRVPIRILK